MDLKEQIENDLRNFVKSGDNVARDALRMLFSDVKNAEINFREKINDEKIIEIVKKNIKSRRDSVEQYTKGKREDLAERERKELEILKKYMPEQISEEEIRKIIAGVIEKSKAVSLSDFGKVMGLAMKEIKSKADGNVVSRIVKEKLRNKK